MSDVADSKGNGERAEPRRRFLDRVKTAFGLKKDTSLRADLEGALQADQTATAEGQAFTPEERAMLRNILGLREVRVADVAVPRADIVAVENDISLGELLALFRDAAHSRLPVYRETLDDPVGMVHIRDFLAYLTKGAPRKPGTGRRKKDEELDLGKIDLTASLANSKLTRRVLFVPPSMPVMDLLVRMQSTRIHMALVIDEYGGTDGLVSIEDLIEQVIGDIADEHDEDETVIQAVGDAWVASARAPLDEVRAALGKDLELIVPDDIAEEVDTLGGLLSTLTGRVPARGELIRGPGEVEFEVLDADPRRVKRIRIRRARPDPEPKPDRPRRGAREVAEAPAAPAPPAADEVPASAPSTTPAEPPPSTIGAPGAAKP